jgi:hypothetical protein
LRAAALPALAWAWVGLILGVGAIATPARFATPGVARPDALNIGRATFGLLNEVEMALCVALLALLAWRRGGRWLWGLAAAVVLLVALQGLWLIPALAARTDMVLAGTTPPPSPLHAIAVAAEGLKLAALATLGWLGQPLARPA